MRRLFSRTGWGEEAAWLTYALSWNEIDHQMADGNHFEFYRNGEWLTKARTGYANIAEGIASSEFRNTMALQNIRPADLGDDDFRVDLWRRACTIWWRPATQARCSIASATATPSPAATPPIL